MFESVVGACLNRCGEWWSCGDQIGWLRFAWVSVVTFCVLNHVGFSVVFCVEIRGIEIHMAESSGAYKP